MKEGPSNFFRLRLDSSAFWTTDEDISSACITGDALTRREIPQAKKAFGMTP
jgi:hypothetical protein